jgi:hypothetical protein
MRALSVGKRQRERDREQERMKTKEEDGDDREALTSNLSPLASVEYWYPYDQHHSHVKEILSRKEESLVAGKVSEDSDQDIN